MHLEKIDDYRWLIPRTYKAGMRTDTMIFASEQLLEAIRRDQSLEQAANVAMLPGIVGRALAMPDIHQGYGFPIGGVAAVDEEQAVGGDSCHPIQQASGPSLDCPARGGPNRSCT